VAGKKGEVFLVNQDVARRRPVQTGTILGDQVEITSGLTVGDRIITRGGFNVKEGDKVNVIRINGEK
jgi:multidrug efflux pump subunit AcrA (membrane-fusion protein)